MGWQLVLALFVLLAAVIWAWGSSRERVGRLKHAEDDLESMEQANKARSRSRATGRELLERLRARKRSGS